MILTPLQKLPKNVEDLGKLIVANGLKKLPKAQKIAQSAHTDWQLHLALACFDASKLFEESLQTNQTNALKHILLVIDDAAV